MDEIINKPETTEPIEVKTIVENESNKIEALKDEQNSEILQTVAELDEIDREIIRLKVETPSITNTEIAKIVGHNRNLIADRIEDHNLDKYIREAQETALQILIDGQTEAAQVLIKIVKSDNEKTTDRINAAKEILKGVLSDKLNIGIDKSSFMQDEEVKKIIQKHGIKSE